MKNWVHNYIRIDRDDILKFLRLDINNKGEVESVVDFERAVPIPSSLDNASSSLNEKRLYYFLSEKLTLCKKEVSEKIKKIGFDNLFSNNRGKKGVSKKIKKRGFDNAFGDNQLNKIAGEVSKYINTLSENEREKFFEDGKQILFNIINYGVPTLKRWYRKYWGCASNACNSKILESNEEEIVIYFETLWTPPIKWCRAISELEIDFHLDWEGGGFRGLVFSYNDGEYTRYHEEKFPIKENEEDE